ncbi:hypothetical protein [Pontibacter sp. H249]|uniref:hypothetical protein n=1 Tax=Pontibacter sp. H249 TaxID=3133420 RepID=UPI0030BAD692
MIDIALLPSKGTFHLVLFCHPVKELSQDFYQNETALPSKGAGGMITLADNRFINKNECLLTHL